MVFSSNQSTSKNVKDVARVVSLVNFLFSSTKHSRCLHYKTYLKSLPTIKMLIFNCDLKLISSKVLILKTTN